MQTNPLKFPKPEDEKRLQDYQVYDSIFAGDHFDAFKIRGDKNFTEKYNRLRYIVANFAGLLSEVMADMMFGERPTIDVEENQTFVDNLMEENSLMTQLYESELVNSSRGDAIFKLRIGQRNPGILDSPPTIIIEEIPAANYFPTLTTSDTRYTPSADVLIYIFKQNNITYMRKETHKPGFIYQDIYGYNETSKTITAQMNAKDFGFEPVQETKVKRSLIFHVPNYRAGKFWGESDYKDLISLFFAINNRLTKTDNILDKHGDPILAVPDGFFDENGKVRQENRDMVQKGDDGEMPEYVVWDAKLESAFEQIDKLVDLLFMISGVARASVSTDDKSGGAAESGRALKFKLISTIRKRNQKILYYDQAIKDMLEICQQLAIAWGIKVGNESVSRSERPKINWGDGIINDQTEEVANSVARVDAGLSSRADEIAKLDGLTPDEAAKKVKEIDEEGAADLSALDNKSGTGGQNGNNGDANKNGVVPISANVTGK